MNTIQKSKTGNVALSIVMIAVMAVLAGCERDEQTADQVDTAAPVTQSSESQRRTEDQRQSNDQRPLEHAVEFDGFTLRTNVSRTDALPEAMARRYEIEPDANRVLLNVVIMENQPNQQAAPVAGEVSARHETLSGHRENIDMRAIEVDGHVSYIGTLDASTQRMFQLVIEALPEGSEQPLEMDFEVRLDTLEERNSD